MIIRYNYINIYFYKTIKIFNLCHSPTRYIFNLPDDFIYLRKIKSMSVFNEIEKCGELHSSEFGFFNVLGTTVGTNGYQGGDAGHGGRTYICFEDLANTALEARVSKSEYGNTKVEILLGGDSELGCIIDSLRWAADTLESIANHSRE